MGKKKKSEPATAPTQTAPLSQPVITASNSVIPTQAPTPVEIGKQYEAQLTLLQQQQEQYATQFNSAFSTLQGDYSNSINLLNSQFAEREATNNSLLSLMQQQVQAAQAAQVQNQERYDSLLKEQNKQVSLLDTLRQRANANLESEQSEGIAGAMQAHTLNSRRKVMQSQQQGNAVNPGLFKATLLQRKPSTKPNPVKQSILR